MAGDGNSVRLIRIFVSSPGDVAEERKVLDKVIERINRTDGNRDKFRLELWQWEQDAVPQIGPNPQDVVDAQMPTDYEIHLGILAHRFGTPTGEYGSGTEKEFRDAVACWEGTKRPWILLYFKRAMVDPATLDLEQYQRVLTFQKSLETASKGLYKHYEGVDGSEQSFADQVEMHLRKLIPQILTSPVEPPSHDAAAQPLLPPEYLSWLRSECGDVDLLGMQLKEGRSLKLDNVYVPLTTSVREKTSEQPTPEALREEQQKPRLLLDLLDEHSLYVSGDPGSGKSTFSRWVSWLACAGTMPERTPAEPDDFKEAFPESFGQRLPLLVRLRDFWTFLPREAGETLSQKRLGQSLAAWLSDRNPPGLTWDIVQAHLKQGTMLLVIDGVDEVPVSNIRDSQKWYPRALLISGLSAALRSWSKADNRILLTSRPHGVSESDRQRLQLTHAPIQDLPGELQSLLVHRWFGILRDSDVEGEKYAGGMLHDLQDRGGVSELTGNPMLLTAMCIIYNEGKRLPQDRCDLYTRIVDNVLYSRFKTAEEVDAVRSELCVVAHAMHAGLGDDRTTPQAQVKYDEIERALGEYRQKHRRTHADVQNLLHRREQLLSHTGLLLSRGDNEAAFYHLSIQEFLAAQRLWALHCDNLAQVFLERGDVTEWRNTLSFLFGMQLSRIGTEDPSIRLLEKLLGKVANDQLGLQIVLGDCLQILMGKGSRVSEESEKRYQRLCLDAIEQEAPLRERHLLGLALGHVGDPRIELDLRNDASFVEIPAGTYAYQEGTQEIERPFLLSRYPVTNSQYALFIEDRGYERREFWSREGWRWRNEKQRTEPDYWRIATYNGPNQPVVTVTFWEAEAFCEWTGGKLPSEKQWEGAARGREGREYPWGDDWKDGICNSVEAGLGRTSAVGLFPGSRSRDFDVEDLAGNVFEWCMEELLTPREQSERAMRGGSHGVGRIQCSSKFRFKWPPDKSGYGFRVAKTCD